MNKSLIITLFTLFGFYVEAQIPLEAGILVGGSVYNGDIDINLSNFIPQSRPACGLFGRMYIHPSVAIRSQLSYLMLYGDEAKYPTSVYRKQRGFNFKTRITELALSGELHLIKINKDLQFDKYNAFITLYGLGGLAGTFYNNKTSFNEPNPVYESVNIDKNHTYPKRALGLFGGGGIKMALSEKASIGGEISARRAQTDYIDGISMVIPSRSMDYYILSDITFTYLFNHQNICLAFSKGKRNIRRFSVCPRF